MKYKHTFLFTMILGLVYAGLLFGYQNGPDPASNGVLGQAACNASGCHVGNTLNAAGGTLTLAGLPTAWTPGQMYGLTVTISKSGAARYGFQLSAVSDSGNQQAGTFTVPAGVSRISVITGSGIQYAQHNQANSFLAPTTTFTVNWTAPASASTGTVRFNLAANAANGNVQNTGDFIYTRVDRVDPAAVAPPPDNSIRLFTLANRGGSLLRTDGVGELVRGYTRIQPDAGSATPSGVAIFGNRQNNVLVSETSVPDSALIQSGRIYAEVSANERLNTGIAVANPNSTDATITFTITNTVGAQVHSGTFQLLANQQKAAFLNGDPFSVPVPVQGTLTFSSSVPISMVALRTFTNERNEFLMSTLPVVDTSRAPSTGTQFIPYFADGAGVTTHILLVNPSDTAMSGNVQFSDQSGALATVNIGGQVNDTHQYSVAARSSSRLSTAGIATAMTLGYVRVNPTGNGPAPVPLVVFTYKPGAFTLSEAGVGAAQGLIFRLYAEASGTAGTAGNVETSFAIANTSATAGTVTFELTNLDGAPVSTTTRPIPASGQIVGFLTNFFTGLPSPFRGILRISTSTPGISVVGIRGRYNENVSYLMTTTPPTNEAATPPSESLFPYFVNGGGFTTEFIVFSGTGSQTSTGNLRFVKSDGTSLSLTLN